MGGIQAERLNKMLFLLVVGDCGEYLEPLMLVSIVKETKAIFLPGQPRHSAPTE
jgi:hypothetical protein